MQRIDVSVYQFSVQGLYRPRQSGFLGYVATTLVIVGLSILRSSANRASGLLGIVRLPAPVWCRRLVEYRWRGEAVQRDWPPPPKGFLTSTGPLGFAGSPCQ